MRYEGNIYRPDPRDYLLQVTMGCSHNKCRFCSFFKNKPFKVRPYEEIEEDILMARQHFTRVPGVFLCDGDALCLNMDKLRPILKKIREVFPESPHTRMYGTWRNVARKTIDELKEMKELGVDLVYTSLETGSNVVLSEMDKGFTAEEAIEGMHKLETAGILGHAGVILGLGGVANSDEHIRGSIDTLNKMQAPLLNFALLSPQPGTPLHEDIISGNFELPTYRQIFREEREIFENLTFTAERQGYRNETSKFKMFENFPFSPEKETFFMSGVFFPGQGNITGVLPRDRDKILRAMKNRDKQYASILDKKIAIGNLV